MGRIRQFGRGMAVLGIVSLTAYNLDSLLPKTKPVEIENGVELIYQSGKPYVEGTAENVLEYLLNQEPSKLEKALEDFGGYYERTNK